MTNIEKAMVLLDKDIYNNLTAAAKREALIGAVRYLLDEAEDLVKAGRKALAQEDSGKEN